MINFFWILSPVSLFLPFHSQSSFDISFFIVLQFSLSPQINFHLSICLQLYSHGTRFFSEEYSRPNRKYGKLSGKWIRIFPHYLSPLYFVVTHYLHRRLKLVYPICATTKHTECGSEWNKSKKVHKHKNVHQVFLCLAETLLIFFRLCYFPSGRKCKLQCHIYNFWRSTTVWCYRTENNLLSRISWSSFRFLSKSVANVVCFWEFQHIFLLHQDRIKLPQRFKFSENSTLIE